MKNTLFKIFIPILVIIILTIFLNCYYNVFLSPDRSPTTFWQDLNTFIFSDENVFENALITLKNTLLGFFIGGVLGIVGGVSIGMNNTVKQLLNPFIDYLRALPSLSIIPLVYMVTPNNHGLIVIIFGSIWPVMVNTIKGVEFINPTSRLVIRQMNISKRDKFLKFTLPEAFPEIILGMKVSLSICLILAITVEYAHASFGGLGSILNHFENQSNYRFVFLVILIIGMIGLYLNILFEAITKQLPWIKNQYETND